MPGKRKRRHGGTNGRHCKVQPHDYKGFSMTEAEARKETQEVKGVQIMKGLVSY